MPGPADASTTPAGSGHPVAAQGDVTPKAEVASQEGSTRVILSGDWRAAADTPSFAAQLHAAQGTLRFDASRLTQWDTRLAAELWSALSAAREAGREVDTHGLPEGLRAVLELALPVSAGAAAGATTAPSGPAAQAPATSVATAAPKSEAPPDGTPRATGWLGQVGKAFTSSGSRARTTLGFLGEVMLALGRLARGRSGLRWRDLAWQLDQTGPRSLPIVSLVSFLVGLILAYMGAAQLQRFGAQIYIADLVTVGVVREIAALMTGIILSGRVGAAFAAQLGSMQANEEIDALRTLGIVPIENLVLPRLIAMVIVAPMLTAYASLVGCLAGLLVAVGIYGVVPLEYLHQSWEAISLTHICVGLLKGTVYAGLVALAGCRQGLYAGRSAQAVGDATTAAVVQSIVWIVVAASALTIAFQRLDI